MPTDDEHKFFFPSFDNNVDNGIICVDVDDDAQQQQSDQTCTTYSNSISVSHHDDDDDAGEAKHDSTSLTWRENHGFITEEECADPPAILLDLDEDVALFDTKGLEEEEKTMPTIDEAEKKKTNMLFVMQDDGEYNSHPTSCKNEFWLSSSSSSSFFGLSGSQTQSTDNDDNDNDDCWNTDRRLVSPSPSPSTKILTTTLTTPSSPTMDTSATALSSPMLQSEQILKEEDDLAAWGEIISAVKKSPIPSMMTDSPTKNIADFNDENFIFRDSFFNNGFDNISGIHNDLEEGVPGDKINNADENEFAVMTAIENNSVGSDDAVFFSVDDIASWSNSANVTSLDEKNEEQEGETNTASTSWENDAESTSQLDTLFNYSLSNEDPVAGDEGNEKLCESGGGNGNELLSTAVVAAFSGAAAILPTHKTVGDHDIMNGHNDSVRYSMHHQAQHQRSSQELNQPQTQQQLHSHQQHQLQHRHHRRRMHPSSLKDQHDKLVDISTLSDDADIQFLLANLEATIGPRGVAPDMESLSGRSSIRSARSAMSDHGQQQQQYDSTTDRLSTTSSSRRGGSGSGSTTRQQYSPSGGASVDSRASRSSRASRKSYRSHHSTRSALTSMSKETRSVANDLFRLEAQIAEQVARQQSGEVEVNGSVLLKSNSTCSGGGRGGGVIHLDSSEEVTSSTDEHDSSTPTRPLGAAPVPRPKTDFELIAPPGKLGILLSNVKTSTQQNNGGISMNSKTMNNATGPTHVSSVRSTSVLAGRVHVGDIFLSIDGEDVTRMNSLEITNLMARKSEYSRVLRLQPLVNSTVAQWQEWI